MRQKVGVVTPLTPFGEKAAAVVKAWRRLGQCEDEFGAESGPACGEWSDALDSAILALEGALPPTEDELVERGMAVVRRLLDDPEAARSVPMWPEFDHDWAVDSITCNTDVTLGWMDRLRVFLRGSLRVRAVIECEHAPGQTAATSRAEIPRILPPRRDVGMQASLEPEPLASAGDRQADRSE